MDKRRTDNTMDKRRTDNTMDKRRTDNTMDKRRTDNTMDKRRTDNTMDKRKQIKGTKQQTIQWTKENRQKEQNNNLLNTTLKAQNRATLTPTKLGLNYDAPEGYAVPAP
jgi:hypothetical protein